MNTDLVFRVLGLLFPGLEPGPLVDELRARLIEELDYAHRGRQPTLLRRLVRRTIRSSTFPRVVDELSTGRVLTTELAERRALRRGRAWSQDERDLARRGDLPLRVPQHLPAPRVQRRPAPGQLPLPARRARHVPRLRAREAVHARRGAAVPVAHRSVRHRARRARVPPVLEDERRAEARPTITDDDVPTTSATSTSSCSDDREVAFDAGVLVGDRAHAFRRDESVRARRESSNVPPAFVVTQRINLGLHAVLGRLHATGELPPHRRRALAVRRRRTVDADGRSRGRVARERPALDISPLASDRARRRKPRRARAGRDGRPARAQPARAAQRALARAHARDAARRSTRSPATAPRAVLVIEGRGPAFSAGHDLARDDREPRRRVLRGALRDVRAS